MVPMVRINRKADSYLLRLLGGLDRRSKQGILLLIDATIMSLSTLLAFSLRLTAFPPSLSVFSGTVLLILCIRVPIFFYYGLYRLRLSTRVQAFSRAVIAGSIASSVVVFSLSFLFPFQDDLRLALLIESPFAAMLLIASREMMISLLHSRHGRSRSKLPVLIYGAGNAGTQLALALQVDEDQSFWPIAFVDKDVSKQGLRMCGMDVIEPSRVEKYIEKHQITTVLLAMPSVKGWKKAPLIEGLQKLGLSIQSVPSFVEIVRGNKGLEDIHVIFPDDLLERSEVDAMSALLNKDVSGKVVCVTGAGGSIGSELCRQIARCSPTGLILFEQSEYNLYEIEMELGREFPGLKLAAILGSVCDRMRMEGVLRGYKVDTVYHAAAYKHVPMVEQNPTEGARNNVLGTLVAAESSLAAGVTKFVLISTDKAVRPTNVMGATKRAAEEVCAYVSAKSAIIDGDLIIGIVRFGNVLDSAGSVVPLFREQMRRGENLTVTHKDVTRYFMTIREAAQLVMQAGAQATCCEVFLLDMGEPIKIMDLAQRMLQLHTIGNGSSEIGIDMVGLRPGEKLYEEMFLDKTQAERTQHAKIWRGVESKKSSHEVAGFIQDLHEVISAKNSEGLVDLLCAEVDGYSPSARASELFVEGGFQCSFRNRQSENGDLE